MRKAGTFPVSLEKYLEKGRAQKNLQKKAFFKQTQPDREQKNERDVFHNHLQLHICDLCVKCQDTTFNSDLVRGQIDDEEETHKTYATAVLKGDIPQSPAASENKVRSSLTRSSNSLSQVKADMLAMERAEKIKRYYLTALRSNSKQPAKLCFESASVAPPSSVLTCWPISHLDDPVPNPSVPVDVTKSSGVQTRRAKLPNYLFKANVPSPIEDDIDSKKAGFVPTYTQLNQYSVPATAFLGFEHYNSTLLNTRQILWFEHYHLNKNPNDLRGRLLDWSSLYSKKLDIPSKYQSNARNSCIYKPWIEASWTFAKANKGPTFVYSGPNNDALDMIDLSILRKKQKGNKGSINAFFSKKIDPGGIVVTNKDSQGSIYSTKFRCTCNPYRICTCGVVFDLHGLTGVQCEYFIKIIVFSMRRTLAKNPLLAVAKSRWADDTKTHRGILVSLIFGKNPHCLNHRVMDLIKEEQLIYNVGHAGVVIWLDAPSISDSIASTPPKQSYT